LPQIPEVPYSCAIQLAYAGAGKGIPLDPASMVKFSFPDIVAIPFAEKLSELHGIVLMESGNSPALSLFSGWRCNVLSR
jgi:hypothetical protein